MPPSGLVGYSCVLACGKSFPKPGSLARHQNSCVYFQQMRKRSAHELLRLQKLRKTSVPDASSPLDGPQPMELEVRRIVYILKRWRVLKSACVFLCLDS